MALKPIAYGQASWHTNITDHCRTAFMAELAKHGYAAADVETLLGARQPRDPTDGNIPVLSAVLTPHHLHEHAVHEEFFKQHMLTKGKELAEARVAIIGQLAAVA